MRSAWITAFACALSVSAARAEERVFFGILHSHTGYSDGAGLPPDAYKRAREDAGCDFFAITEHNHFVQITPKRDPGDPKPDPDQIIGRTHANYNGSSKSLVAAARAATNQNFVALYGQEFSSISSGNHMNVFDVPEVIDAANGHFDQLVTWLKKPEHADTTGQIAILQFNHPSTSLRNKGIEYGADNFGSKEAWFAATSPLACTIEVVNGPGLSTQNDQPIPNDFESSYSYYLSEGFRLAPTADQDNHHHTWGTLTTARTGIIAETLTKDALLAAIRARHVYASTDRNLRVIVRTSGGMEGDVLPLPTGNELQFQVSIQDDDETEAAYTIEPVIGIAGSHRKVTRLDPVAAPNGNNTYTVDEIPNQGAGQFVYFKIRQANEDGDDDTVWTAPTWFGALATPTSAPAPDTAGDFIASRKSAVYHTNLTCSSVARIKPENRVTGDEARQGRTPHDCVP